MLQAMLGLPELRLLDGQSRRPLAFQPTHPLNNPPPLHLIKAAAAAAAAQAAEAGAPVPPDHTGRLLALAARAVTQVQAGGRRVAPPDVPAAAAPLVLRHLLPPAEGMQA
jgi:hypothetical protein